MRNLLILLSGGRGKRFGSSVPKGLVSLGGKPIFIHSLLKFQEFEFINEVFLVIPRGYRKEFDDALKRYKIRKLKEIVIGGKERVDSLINAFDKVEGADYIFIHDSARPLFKEDLIRRLYEEVKKYKAVVPAIRVTSTIRYCKGKWGIRTVQRQGLYEVQTPQVFKYELLRQAINYLRRKNKVDQVPDDAYLLELMGRKVRILEGDPLNIKITYPDDLKLAEAILKCR